MSFDSKNANAQHSRWPSQRMPFQLSVPTHGGSPGRSPSVDFSQAGTPSPCPRLSLNDPRGVIMDLHLTARDVLLLLFACTHYAVLSRHVRRALFPDSKDGSAMRRRLNRLCHAGYLAKAQAEVITPGNNVGQPVYYPTRRCAEFLAVHTGDMRWLCTPTQRPYSNHLAHFVALTDLRLLLHAALAGCPSVRLEGFLNQFDVANPEAESAAERYRLYTVIHRPAPARPVVCVPDGAFGLRVVGTEFLKAYYLELERGTTPPAKAAAKKSPGYAALAAENLHRRHFPEALPAFAVLVIAPHANWRRHLQREFARRPSPQLYKFAAWPELEANPAGVFFEPVWYTTAGEAQALVKNVPQLPGGVKAAVNGVPPVPGGVTQGAQAVAPGSKPTVDRST